MAEPGAAADRRLIGAFCWHVVIGRGLLPGRLLSFLFGGRGLRDVKRVPDGALDYPGEDGLYYHDGAPFTGVAFDRAGRGLRAESEFRDGMPWGVNRTWHSSGAPASEKQSAAGVFHGLCQEWDEQGRLTLYEVCELGVAVWRRRWAAGVLVEDWRLTESDNDYATLQMLRKHFMRGLVELGRQSAEPLSWPTDLNENENPGSG